MEDNHDVYRGKDCIKMFFEAIREHTMVIINFEKKKIFPLINKEYELYFNKVNCHICRKQLEYKHTNNKNIVQLEIIVPTQVITEVLLIAYVT